MMPFTPFSSDQQLEFLLNTLRRQLPEADLSAGSFWQIWAHGQTRGLAGVTSALHHTLRQILPDRAVGLDLDHHASIYDLPRRLPQRAAGRVTGVATATIAQGVTDLHLVDPVGRIYDLDDLEGFEVPLPGVFEVAVTAREAGASGNQVTGAPLTFSGGGVPAGLEPKARVLAPGLAGGSDLETDPALQDRIGRTLTAGRLRDRRADYEAWALAAPTFDPEGEGLRVSKAWVYRDPEAPARVYVLPLAGSEERIGPPGFCQAVFEAVAPALPVTVDLLVPRVAAEEIDVTLAVTPRRGARWDWYGLRRVGASASTTDRTLVLEVIREGAWVGGAAAVSGLRTGMRVLVRGEQRVIGHVDHAVGAITLTGDLSAVPEPETLVRPGGPVVEPVQKAVEDLFDVLTPIHRAAALDLSPSNILASAITDAVMELAEVHDVEVQGAEALLQTSLLSAAPYVAGTRAYLARPGAITVVPK